MVKLAEVFGVSVSELLGEEIKDVEEKLEVAEQLSKLNALLAIQMQRKHQFWSTVIKVIGIIVLLAFVAAIYPSWTETWNEFGQNLYHILH